jgi:hypothetical protein
MRPALISLPTLHLARVLGLVKRITPEPVHRRGRADWVLRVHGRGFTALLRATTLPGQVLPAVCRPACFLTRRHAQVGARRLGLPLDC